MDVKTARLYVSTHSRPKAAGVSGYSKINWSHGFNTQPPEGGWIGLSFAFFYRQIVSTHSRPKAAGFHQCHHTASRPSFNTQPPEGGWGGGRRV